eukprot:8753968-Pyramimonas_sp.AAC.1
MRQGLENLISFCWNRHPPGHPGVLGEPQSTRGVPNPLRASPDWRAQPGQGPSRHYYAVSPALAQLDLSWLV